MKTRQGRLSVAIVIVLVALGACGGKDKKPTAQQSSAPPPPTTAPPPTFPLTGLPLSGDTAGRPALSVKIDNVSAALPQSGLNQTDVVYEELVEGGQTRLFAVFHSQDADPVGPIRSARPVDADLLNQLGGGIFAYSGAAPGEIAPVEEHSGATLLSFDAGVSAFHRDTSRSAPHNVYSSTPALYQAGADAGNQSGPPPPQFKFGAVAGGRPVTDADMIIGERANAAWHWNAATGAYDRDQDGAPDVLADGSRVTANDVLIMSVQIQGTGIFDTVGEEDPLVVVIGQGPCWLLRDGQLVEGTWSRPDTTAPTTFHDANGAALLLHPGRTWVELLPNTQQPNFH